MTLCVPFESPVSLSLSLRKNRDQKLPGHPSACHLFRRHTAWPELADDLTLCRHWPDRISYLFDSGSYRRTIIHALYFVFAAFFTEKGFFSFLLACLLITDWRVLYHRTILAAAAATAANRSIRFLWFLKTCFPSLFAALSIALLLLLLLKNCCDAAPNVIRMGISFPHRSRFLSKSHQFVCDCFKIDFQPLSFSRHSISHCLSFFSLLFRGGLPFGVYIVGWESGKLFCRTVYGIMK